MNSRIDTIFSKFDLYDRSWENVKKHGKIFDVCYENIESKLESERNKTITYLNKVFNEINTKN